MMSTVRNERHYVWLLWLLPLVAACGKFDPRTPEAVDPLQLHDAGTRELVSAVEKPSSAEESKAAPVQTGSASEGSCGGKRCSDPAVCKDGRCTCPEGYDDPKGDGSECKDRDECAARSSDCPRGARCKNTPGSYECECTGPAYTGDGKQCDCAKGYTRSEQGLCLLEDGQACTDSLDCLHNACESGICCAQSCGSPGECQVATGATCKDGKTCEYETAKDGTSCDDLHACTAQGTCKAGKCLAGTEPTNCDDKNPCTDDSCEEPLGCKNQNKEGSCDDGNLCTSNDHCAGGSCQGTSRECPADSGDVCNVSSCDPKTGSCIKAPRMDSVACNDGDSCTAMDKCQAGKCLGEGNACGINATACMPGSPNTCTCAEGFVSAAGSCKPTMDECASNNPCSPNAICTDPSNMQGDVTCACKPGFMGNGVQCTAVDSCNPNPCGADRGTCKADGMGGHSCTCNAGFREVAGNCVCDMTGDFAVRLKEDLVWKNVSDFIEDGSASTYTWIIQRQRYDAAGQLQMEVQDCGATTFDFCSVPFPPLIGAEAYTQYFPMEIWGTPSMPRFNVSFSLPNAAPGSPFVSPTFAMFSGISLTDPFGPWPPSYKDVTGGPGFDGSAVNGATWLDQDNDTALGVTTIVVPPGGERRDGTAPEPPQDYGANSVDCPRSGSGAREPYAYLPALPQGISLTPIRIKRYYTGTRTLLGYSGSIVSCDRVNGDVVGPAAGNKLQIDGRIGGCIRVNGSGESACADSQIEFLDETPQSQEISKATFEMRRLPAGATCKDVVSANYD